MHILHIYYIHTLYIYVHLRTYVKVAREITNADWPVGKARSLYRYLIQINFVSSRAIARYFNFAACDSADAFIFPLLSRRRFNRHSSLHVKRHMMIDESDLHH